MNKNLLQPYFSIENFYGNIVPSSQSKDDSYINPINNERKCCDNDGLIYSS